MAIEGFDYKEFASSMAEQAKELVPADLQENEKEYIVKTLGNFTLLAGEALYNDNSMELTADQAVFITQLIAEWSYHKSIDLVHSGILPEYWDTIMQKIAFTIFEVAKQAVIRKIPQDQLLQAVEHHVVKVYKQSIEELEEKGIINEEIKTRAESQSNIDAMAKQAQDEQIRKQEEKARRQKEIADWSINELSICIYSAGQVEFLRYQSIDTDMSKWVANLDETGDVTFTYNGDIQDYRLLVTDQVLELDRMMNFFKFSLHKGEKSVDEIIIMGDNPLLDNISAFLRDNLATPITVIDDVAIEKVYPQFKAKHASLIGLALKEVQV